MSQYTQPQPGFTAPSPARNGLGTAALVLGIIGIIFGVIPFLFWIGTILGLLALILGLVGRGRAKRGEATNKGTATAGTVLGLLALIASVVIGIVTVMAVDEAVDEINKSVENTAPKDTTTGGQDGAAKEKGNALAADETSVYDDDVRVTVSAPEPYTPGEFAVGHTKGNKAYQVTITIENAGKEKYDANLVTVDARAGKDGVTAEQIFDDKAGAGFEGTILPGKKATVTFAFDAPADAKNLTVEVSPGFDYDASHWELTV
ncbi:DUF4352 domain-containing protein [Streptomyces xantholiticus]|uniref:DUF4352 domain-containing protein n=1 Tax=Streptomyces xantholiticus TaxID=68285 RepID=UPI00167685AF|nr:DUF4352 domain-containing protein [Streptomyces xantholiticus]GGW42400.1 hypothetical protein GCM10010381_29330 [Streptomyces xantholiticus]